MAASKKTRTEKLTVNQLVSENYKQNVVRGTISIPDAKPNVDQIISTDKTCSIKHAKLLPDKVLVEGMLTLQIVYVAFDPSQSVHHMHGQVPFTAYVDLPGALPGMDVTVDCVVEDVQIVPNKGDCRKYNVTAVLDVLAKVTETQDVEVLVEVPNDMTANYDIIQIDDVVGRETAQAIISDEFDNPSEKPVPEKILDVDSNITITEARIVADKVIVDGEVALQIMYVGAVPEQSVHSMHTNLMFTDYIEVPGATPDMDVVVDAVIENCDVEIKGCPYFVADCVIKLQARVTEPREVRVVTECPGNTVNTVELNVEQLIGRESSQVVVRESFESPDPKPCPEKILNVFIENIKIREKKIIKNKVIVRGYVDVKIVYVAAKPDQAVHAMHQQLNFRTFMEIKRATEDMDVDVKAVVEYLNAEVMDCCDINIECIVKVKARVTQTLRRTVCAGVVSEEECTVGEVIHYTVKPGDTLFAIAQKYNTSVNQILKINPGLNPDNLQVGQVIKVPCGAKG